MKARTSLKRSIAIAAVFTAALGFGVSPASAAYYTNSLGSPVSFAIGDDDDGSTGGLQLGFDFSLFGSLYSDVFVNTNGNVSFGGPSLLKTLDPLNTTTEAPMIAPYWGDVDLRGSGQVFMRTDPNQVVITWDNVGFFDQNASPTASFQLVLRGADYHVPPGEGRIGFFYNTLGWEASDAYGGTGGFGGDPGNAASAGFSDGLADVNPGEIVLAGSGIAGIGARLSDTHIWFRLQGPEALPALVPEPATMLLVALGLLGLASARRRRV
jgi:hypothetical protein